MRLQAAGDFRAKLTIDHADLELRDFEPPDGTTRLREFIDERWGEARPSLRQLPDAATRRG